MSFLVISLIAFVLVAFPTYYKLRTDSDKPYHIQLFICTILGALLSFYTGYKANLEANDTRDSLNKKDKLYQSLLNKNLNSADIIITKQNLALKSLTNQINFNSKLLTNTKQALFEINRGDNPLLDIQLNFTVKYPMVRRWQYENYLLESNKPYETEFKAAESKTNLLTLIKRSIEDSTLVLDPEGIDMFDRKTGDRYSHMDILVYNYKNVTLYKKPINKDTILTKLIINKPDLAGDKIFDKYAMGISSRMQLLLFKSDQSKNAYDFNMPDLVLGLGNESSSIKINSSEVDFIAKNQTENITLNFTKVRYNGKIKSLIDLKNATMVIFWEGFRPEFKDMEIRYGDHYANTIKINVNNVKLKKDMSGTSEYSYLFKNQLQ